MYPLRLLLIALIPFTLCYGQNQNEAKKWYFGSNAGLDFTTNPPTVLTNNVSGNGEGTASIADANGNLLFYIGAQTIFNQAHAVMANGSGLIGPNTDSQPVLIVQKPASMIYYIFHIGVFNNTPGFYYSIVDMSLAAGMGSVTTKNAVLLPNYASAQIVSGTKHCNGIDTWVVTHEFYPGKFYAFLVSAFGLNSTPIISTVGKDTINARGQLKFSPNGKKVSVPLYINGSGAIGIHDFDNSTGAVSSNSITLNMSITADPYGSEFSPDGSKFYATNLNPVFPPFNLFQWDLCAGNEQAISASKYIVHSVNNVQKGSLQIATNGKIYAAISSADSIGVINNPNLAGVLCSYTNKGQSLVPKNSTWGLPNFISSYFKPAHPPFSFSVNCQNVTFTGITGSLCAFSSYSLINSAWNFGDPSSGIANTTSNVINPSHYYSGAGTYTAQVILNYKCSSDTLKQVVTISNLNPSFNFTGNNAICAKENATISANGSYTYSWNIPGQPVASGTSIAVNPTVTTIYTVTANGGNGCLTTQTVQLVVNKCTGITEFLSGKQWKVYPNPANELLIVESDEDLNIQLTDITGRVLLVRSISKGKNQLLISNLAEGIYLISLQGETGTSSQKVMVAR